MTKQCILRLVLATALLSIRTVAPPPAHALIRVDAEANVHKSDETSRQQYEPATEAVTVSSPSSPSVSVDLASAILSVTESNVVPVITTVASSAPSETTVTKAPVVSETMPSAPISETAAPHPMVIETTVATTVVATEVSQPAPALTVNNGYGGNKENNKPGDTILANTATSTVIVPSQKSKESSAVFETSPTTSTLAVSTESAPTIPIAPSTLSALPAIGYEKSTTLAAAAPSSKAADGMVAKVTESTSIPTISVTVTDAPSSTETVATKIVTVTVANVQPSPPSYSSLAANNVLAISALNQVPAATVAAESSAVISTVAAVSETPAITVAETIAPNTETLASGYSRESSTVAATVSETAALTTVNVSVNAQTETPAKLTVAAVTVTESAPSTVTIDNVTASVATDQTTAVPFVASVVSALVDTQPIRKLLTLESMNDGSLSDTSEAIGYAQKQSDSEPKQHDLIVSPSDNKNLIAKLPSKQIDFSTKNTIKWKPFYMDCALEVDERGALLCGEWARGGICLSHRATMFLFCRRTCLCVGPPKTVEEDDLDDKSIDVDDNKNVLSDAASVLNAAVVLMEKEGKPMNVIERLASTRTTTTTNLSPMTNTQTPETTVSVPEAENKVLTMTTNAQITTKGVVVKTTTNTL